MKMFVFKDVLYNYKSGIAVFHAESLDSVIKLIIERNDADDEFSYIYYELLCEFAPDIFYGQKSIEWRKKTMIARVKAIREELIKYHNPEIIEGQGGVTCWG